MGLQPDECLLALKPLYGIPESGLHWFLNFQDRHKTALVMKTTRVDPCILTKRNGTSIEGITPIQVDDTFGRGTEELPNLEEIKTHEKF